MASRFSEFKLGSSELRTDADLIERLNFCIGKAKWVNKLFRKEMMMEKRGIRHKLDAAEIRVLNELRVEIGIIYNEINRLLNTERFDIKT